MKKMILSCMSRIISLGLLFAVMTVYSTAVLALPDNKSLMGELVVNGKMIDGNSPFVLLNGEQVISGNTVLSSSTISTTDSSSARVELGKLGYVSLSPNSSMSLSFDEKTISGIVIAGNVKVFNNEGILVKIQTPNGVSGNEAADLTSQTTEASAETDSATLPSQQTQSDDSKFPYVLFGVSVIVAATVVAAFVSSRDNNNNGQIGVSPTR